MPEGSNKNHVLTDTEAQELRARIAKLFVTYPQIAANVLLDTCTPEDVAVFQTTIGIIKERAKRRWQTDLMTLTKS